MKHTIIDYSVIIDRIKLIRGNNFNSGIKLKSLLMKTKNRYIDIIISFDNYVGRAKYKNAIALKHSV